MDHRALRQLAAEHSSPLQQGSLCTFLYQGEAATVRFHHWVDSVANGQPFTRITGSDLWHLTLQVPERARVEYKLEVSDGADTRLVRDPLNPLLAHDPFGANSVCYGPGYSTPNWALVDASAAPGTIETRSIVSGVFDQRRDFDLYLPHDLEASKRLRVLIVHDGHDYVRYSSLKTVLDNLIHRREVAPLIAVLTSPGDRLREYAGDPRHARFLTDEVLPALEAEFSLDLRSAERGLMGASFGAVAALYTAWRSPRHYGRLLLQSGSFVARRRGGRRRGPEFRPVVAFTQLLRSNPRQFSERIYMSCGAFESLARHNHELAGCLRDTGMEVRYSEAPDGHNWENWRDRLEEALSFLFPAPPEPHGVVSDP